jgi:hypothetical protein
MCHCFSVVAEAVPGAVQMLMAGGPNTAQTVAQSGRLSIHDERPNHYRLPAAVRRVSAQTDCSGNNRIVGGFE